MLSLQMALTGKTNLSLLLGSAVDVRDADPAGIVGLAGERATLDAWPGKQDLDVVRPRLHGSELHPRDVTFATYPAWNSRSWRTWNKEKGRFFIKIFYILLLL